MTNPTDRKKTVIDAAGGSVSDRRWTNAAITLLLLVLVVLIFGSLPRSIDRTLDMQASASERGRRWQYDRP